jgi:hypothetical protein
MILNRRVALVVPAVAIAASVALSFVATTTSSTAMAEDNRRLDVIADLVGHKGFDIYLGPPEHPNWCDLFHLHGRVGDGTCSGFGLSADADDKDDRKALDDLGYPKGWEPAFEWNVENGTQIRRVFMWSHNDNAGNCYVFLTGVDGKLQGAIAGTLNGVPPHAHWEYRGPVAVTADMQDMFDKAIAFWISPYAKKGLEGLPNKR